jgi:(1->4)-alpha-D-glucan 1-alpha-D-glucosylmutase
VPDLYQGCEIWDNSLVDPDNRRPVDFGARRALLAALEAGPGPAAILAAMDEGLPKLHLIREALALRARRPGCFGPGGGYQPLLVSGRRPGHLIAFSRGADVAVVVPRLTLGLREGWEDSAAIFGPGRWRNVLDGRTFGDEAEVADLLSGFPVALLERES